MREAGIGYAALKAFRFSPVGEPRNHRKIICQLLQAHRLCEVLVNLAERYMLDSHGASGGTHIAAGGQGCSTGADRLPTRLVLCGPYTDYIPIFPENKLRYFLGADCNEVTRRPCEDIMQGRNIHFQRRNISISAPYFLPTSRAVFLPDSLVSVDVRLMLPSC